MELNLTTAIMIIDKTSQKAFMLERIKSWQGLACFGGHVEIGESFFECAIREIKEETGFTVKYLEPKGIIHFEFLESGNREFIKCYNAYEFSGEPIWETHEGKARWVSLENIYENNLSEYFDLQLKEIFLKEGFHEIFYLCGKNNEIIKTALQ